MTARGLVAADASRDLSVVKLRYKQHAWCIRSIFHDSLCACFKQVTITVTVTVTVMVTVSLEASSLRKRIQFTTWQTLRVAANRKELFYPVAQNHLKQLSWRLRSYGKRKRVNDDLTAAMIGAAQRLARPADTHLNNCCLFFIVLIMRKACIHHAYT